jgi:hypothetical protein
MTFDLRSIRSFDGSCKQVLREESLTETPQATPRASAWGDRILSRCQDAEYLDACAEWQRREEERVQVQKEAEEERRGKADLIMARYCSLGPEPAEGTTIAVTINDEKKMRKFRLDDPAEYVYIWVACECLAGSDLKDSDAFELRLGRQVIKREEPLKGQKLTGRVLLRVWECENETTYTHVTK